MLALGEEQLQQNLVLLLCLEDQQLLENDTSISGGLELSDS